MQTKFWLTCALLGVCILPLSASAQTEGTPATVSANPASVPTVTLPPALGTLEGMNGQSTPIPRLQMGKVPLKEAVNRLSRISHVALVTDRFLGGTSVNMPTVSGSIDTVLPQVLALLPAGTTVRKIYLPAPPAETAFDGDTVYAVIAANDALNPTVRRQATAVASPAPRPLPEGTVEILGRQVSGAQAQSLIAALDLKPVYLITRYAAANDPVARLASAQTDNLRLWMSLTPEQRKAAGNQQLDTLLNMDSDLRRALFAQQSELSRGFMQKIMALPEQQRSQLFLDITGGKFDGRGLPAQPPTPAPKAGQ